MSLDADHRTPEQLMELLRQLLDAANRSDPEAVKALVSPLFLDEDWCCVYALVGGLLEVTKEALPPVPPGVPVRLASPGANAAEHLWGCMVTEHLRGHDECVLALFHSGMGTGTAGAAIAFGVVSTAQLDRKRRARLQ